MALFNSSVPAIDRDLFKDLKTIVVFGCSSNPYRTSYHIAQYIQQAGFRMIPVNPNETEVLGETCYPDLASIPEGVNVDLIDLFRNKVHCYETVEEIIEWAGDRPNKPVIWTQLDVSTPKAKALAEEHGFPYVENRCFMVEHRRAE
ncbi:MAG: CoA-binding protein [Balneolaceae bacterium]|nr:CoA-binding protein [Balneolaceae bacterium]MCH8549134.1 CoA-binding protein [Balneolaceae bacterium]